MKLLALDSSGLVASVAVMTEEVLLAEYSLNYKKTHSQTLLPMLDEVVKMLGIGLEEMDAIAVAGGPGSFTGLRIGSATAKGLGLALNKPLIHIPTLEALACNLYGTQETLVCPMMDARRNQVYTGIYRLGDRFEVLEDQKACPVEEVIEDCNRLGESVIFLGDGVPVYKNFIEEGARIDFRLAPPHLSRQRAGAVGMRALMLYREGKTQTAAEHVPVYLRKSQAERELIQKGGHLPDDD